MEKIRLPKTVAKSKKRQGRGMGSGKGSHTSGRGQKGQKSRGSISVLFEGMKVKKSFFKRLPLMRGKGKFHPKAKAVIVNYKRLEALPEGTTIDMKLLFKMRLVNEKLANISGVKILGVGKNPKKFKFSVPTSRKVVAPEKEVKASK